MKCPRLPFLLLVAALPIGAGEARAAAVNDVIDSYERTSEEPVEVLVRTTFDVSVRTGSILREFRCLAHDQAALGQYCPDGSQIMDAEELAVERNTQTLNIDLELGLWRAASFRLRLPLVLFDQTELTHADGVNAQSSSVDPGDAFPPPSVFTVPFTGQQRSGLGDPTVGVRFTPLSWARDSTRPTFAIDFDLTIPRLARENIKQATNEAVGEGTFVLDISTALSARPRAWVEPYFEAGASLRFASAESLFEDQGPTQTLVSPGHGMHSAFGIEFIPWENRADERSVVFDLGGGLDYRFEGREYTDLFEALGASGCDPRDTQEPCDLTTYDRGDIDPETGERRKTDGITDVEQYALLNGWVGLRYQPLKWVRLGAHFHMGYEMPHFLTFADAGRDLDGKNQVERDNSTGDNEFNPVYNDSYDSLGARFRSGGATTYGFAFSLQGKF